MRKTGKMWAAVMTAAAIMLICGSAFASEQDQSNVQGFEPSCIPVMVIHIDESRGTIAAMNESPDHSVRCYGTVDFIVPEDFVCEYTDEVQEGLEGLQLKYIRGRGNSTWSQPKKPYRLAFEEKVDFCGMGESKNWGLLANRFDNSLMRNRITYWLGRELGMEFVPKCVPVDLVINDEYYGSYLLTELIRVEKSRVAIDPLDDAADEEPEITGGYLIGTGPQTADPESDPDLLFTERGMSVICVDPDFKESGTDKQKAYLADYLQKTENALFGENFADEEGVSYSEYLDVDSAVDYWWIQELSMNSDAYGSDSTYLNKRRNDLLYWGPLWDFDYVTWGNLETGDLIEYTGFYNEYNLWMNRLLWNEEFTGKLAARWTDIREDLVRLVEDGGIIDQYYEQTKVSESYDVKKWGFYEIREGSLEEGHTYADETAWLKEWISLRMGWIDENIGNLEHPVRTVTFIADDEIISEVSTLWGRFLPEMPEAPEKEGFTFAGWLTETGEVWEEGEETVTEDMKLYAGYQE